MRIDPRKCGRDFAYNQTVEREIARILQHYTDLQCSDFSNGTRAEYDWKIAGVPIELKLSTRDYIPVEVAKDEEQTVPSGLAASEAYLTLVLSKGYNNLPGNRTIATGKLRLFPTRKLLSYARRHGRPEFFNADKPSERALVFKVFDAVGKAGEIWLGDVPIVFGEHASDPILYDLGQFTMTDRGICYFKQQMMEDYNDSKN